MNVDDYRKAFDEQVRAERQALESRATIGMEAATSPAPTQTVDQAIAVFRDPAQPPAQRLNALHDVQTATFAGSHFNPYRAAYRDALRQVAKGDDASEVRASALEILAAQKDDVARDLLLKGLDDASQAIVTPAKAIQLLAHDDHGAAIPVARKVATGNYDNDAKEEALRALASDSASEPLFTKVLSDRSEPENLRSVSAAGLRVVNPERFREVAQGIVTDNHENDDVRANCLGALNHMQGYSTRVDPSFAQEVSKIQVESKSESLRSAADSFMRMRTPE